MMEYSEPGVQGFFQGSTGFSELIKPLFLISGRNLPLSGIDTLTPLVF